MKPAGLVTLLCCVLAFACGDDDSVVDGLDGRVIDRDGSAMPICLDPPRTQLDEQPCQCAGDCQEGAVCVTEAEFGWAGGACSRVCDPTAPTCSAGAECVVSMSSSMGLCQRTCETPGDCEPGRVCAYGHCLFHCQQDSDCLSGHCDLYSGACTDGTPREGKGSLEPCVRNEECLSLSCEPAEGRCLSGCSLERQGCPGDEVCVTIAMGSDYDYGVCAVRCMLDGDCAHLGLVCRVTTIPGATVRACAKP